MTSRWMLSSSSESSPLSSALLSLPAPSVASFWKTSTLPESRDWIDSDFSSDKVRSFLFASLGSSSTTFSASFDVAALESSTLGVFFLTAILPLDKRASSPCHSKGSFAALSLKTLSFFEVDPWLTEGFKATLSTLSGDAVRAAKECLRFDDEDELGFKTERLLPTVLSLDWVLPTELDRLLRTEPSLDRLLLPTELSLSFFFSFLRTLLLRLLFFFFFDDDLFLGLSPSLPYLELWTEPRDKEASSSLSFEPRRDFASILPKGECPTVGVEGVSPLSLELGNLLELIRRTPTWSGVSWERFITTAWK